MRLLGGEAFPDILKTHLHIRNDFSKDIVLRSGQLYQKKGSFRMFSSFISELKPIFRNNFYFTKNVCILLDPLLKRPFSQSNFSCHYCCFFFF